ncbi:MAG: caspase family protein [Pyrinomonadaceae bacterium]
MKVRLRVGLVVSVLLCVQTVQLWAQTPELVVQTGHSRPIISIAFSADGKMLATGSTDHTIKLWDVATGRELRTLTGHSDGIGAVAFSVNGKTLASAGLDNTIKSWDVATGRELRTLTRYPGVLLALSPEAKTLASGSNDGTIRLWDVATSRELHTLSAHSRFVTVAFNADGQTLASGGGSDDPTIRLWDVATGRELHTLTGHSGEVTEVAFSADGNMLASGSGMGDSTINLWDVASGRRLKTLAGDGTIITSVAFSADGRTLASGSYARTIKLWDVATGSKLRTLTGSCASALIGSVRHLAFSADGKNLASGSDCDGTLKLWDVATGRELRTTIHTDSVESVAFSADGKALASITRIFDTFPGSTIKLKLWDLSTGMGLRTLTLGENSTVALSADGKTLASCDRSSPTGDQTIKLWNVNTGLELRTLRGHSHFVTAVAFSPDGKMLASGSMDKTIMLWDVTTGGELHTLTGHTEVVYDLTFSADGKTLASAGVDETIKLWDAANGRNLRTLTSRSGHLLSSLVFSGDTKTLASGWDDSVITLWDVDTGGEVRSLAGNPGGVNSIAFSVDGKILASSSRVGTIKLWEVATGRELRTLTGHSLNVNSVAFSANGKFLISGSDDRNIKVWDTDSGKELASLIALDEKDWAVVTPDGRFDASSDAQKLMYWRVGNEIIGLEQLKERYYEPGLLAKILGFNHEPLRDVSKFENPRLGPDVGYDPLAKGSSNLTVSLTNRGGGIGRVQVFVNGKEFLADARDEKLKQNPNVEGATLKIDLSKATGAITGKDNDVRVVAWNVENYISSRGTELVWTAGGPTDRAPPEVYAIIGGISTYAGSQLNLNFAAKDAVDIANAIELGAKRLFGADKVHLTLLSTAEDPRAIVPTKEKFTKAFEIARQAKPTDILIVYLAGHGITLQRGSDMYCYLTKEARTSDTAALSDSAVRKQQTITSEELVEWIRQIPALKQVVMLDTCAAGAAQVQLKLVDKREASGDAIRAIDRAKDRTGSYILMGSAADAVSYEASQYGQGLLTYALLKGMKGAALRNDEFVDVSKLFQFAREEVEQLAKNVGGIQKPIVFAPKDDSFEVGQLKSEDKVKIALATPRPMILRPRFFDTEADDDTLNLMKMVRARLRDESFVTGRGSSQAVMVFVDDEEFPGGIRPTGRYTVNGNTVTVTLRLRRDGVEIGNAQVIGTKDDVPGLAAKLIESVKEAIKKLPPR